MRVIVVGAGTIGSNIAERLAIERHEVTVVERNPARLAALGDIDVRLVEGSGSHPDVLEKAGAGTAEMLLAVTDSDEVNLVACLVGRLVNPGIIQIARVRAESLADDAKIKNSQALAIKYIINPEEEAAEKVQRILQMPQAQDILPFAEGRVLLVAFPVSADAPIAGRPLKDAAAEEAGRLLIAGFERQGALGVPTGDTVLKPGDRVYIATTRTHLDAACRLVGRPWKPVRDVMVYGGGRVGLLVARGLEARGVRVKLIEPDEDHARELAEELRTTRVFHGNGNDEELLREENVAGMDAFVAASGDEEDNILSSLLAKSLGAKLGIALIDRPEYARIVGNLGIDAAVSPQLSAAGSILRHVRRGLVLSVAEIRDQDGEAIEYKALLTSDIVGRPLKELDFPRHAIVMAVVRGDKAIIPTGETVIEADDRVIVFARREAIGAVEARFQVSPEFFG